MSSIPQFFPGLPDYPAITALRDFRQWVAWAWKKKADGSFTKPPINPHTGFGASHSNPLQWGSYDEALARAQRDHLAGIGFVLEPGDDLTGSDLDDCRDPVSGSLEPWAAKIVALRETYTEVSPSGCGIRMMWKGKIESAIKCDPAHVEIYCRSRYLTITGQHVAGTPFEILPAPKTLAALRARVAEFREPDVMPSSASNGAAGQSGNSGRSDFRDINDRAMAELGAWVPYVFPRARFQPATRAWRVTSADLGRNLEEDLSLAPNGIVDFGVADIGDPRQGKRTPIDIVLEFGGAANVLDAAKWLADRVGGENPFTPDPVAAESQANLAARAPPVAPSPFPEPATRQPALDFSDLSDLVFPGGDPYAPSAMPGIAGAVTRHMLETALYPVPDFACLSALVFCSTLFGRRWVDPIMGGGLNVYAIATAPTGWGKDHPLQEPRKIAYQAQMMHMMGPGEFKSDAAIEKTLRKNPVRASYVDEIGIVFQANASKQANSWERRIRKALLELYSSSKGMWTGSQAAGDKDEIDKGAEPLHQPVLSIYGTSTPEELYRGLTEDNIQDGLFGRLIFTRPDEKPTRQRPGDGKYPEIVEAIEAIRSFTPAGIKAKQKDLYHIGLRSATTMPFTVRVPIDDIARASLELIDNWQRDLTEKETALAKIANRAAENAGKLATIRALSTDHTAPIVRLEDVQWAWTIIQRSLFVIAGDIEKHLVGSEWEGLVKAILAHVGEAGKNGITFVDLRRRRGIGKAHGRDLNAAIKMLESSGEISVGKPGNRGFRLRKN